MMSLVSQMWSHKATTLTSFFCQMHSYSQNYGQTVGSKNWLFRLVGCWMSVYYVHYDDKSIWSWLLWLRHITNETTSAQTRVWWNTTQLWEPEPLSSKETWKASPAIFFGDVGPTSVENMNDPHPFFFLFLKDVFPLTQDNLDSMSLLIMLM